MEVEIVSDTALKLRYCKHAVTRTDVYGGILLLYKKPRKVFQVRHAKPNLFCFSEGKLKDTLPMERLDPTK